MPTMKIPNGIVRTSTSIRFFESIIFRQRFTASAWARTVWSASSEPCPRRPLTRTEQSVTTTRTPFLAKS